MTRLALRQYLNFGGVAAILLTVLLAALTLFADTAWAQNEAPDEGAQATEEKLSEESPGETVDKEGQATEEDPSEESPDEALDEETQATEEKLSEESPDESLDEEAPSTEEAPSDDSQNAGLDDLDLAIEKNLSVESLGDMAAVIRLANSALEKGLDEGDRKMAEALLASSLIRRGKAISAAILKKSPPDPRWPQFRHVALMDLEKAITLAPKQPTALLLIARLNLLPKGDRQRAGEAVDQAIVLLADEPRQRAKALALRAEMQDTTEKKLSYLNEALELAPDDVSLLRVRGMMRAAEKDHEGALADFDKALELEGDDAPTHQARGLMLAHLKRWDEAIAALDKAAELAPNSATPWVQKARVYAEQKDYPAALDALNKAHDLEPANIGVLVLRAGVYETQDKWDKALEDIDAVLAMNPNLPNGRRMRAAILSGLGQIDQAVAEIEQLLKDRPNDAAARLQLAAYLAAQEKTEQAIALYSELIEGDAKNWRALRGRGDLYLNAGNQVDAIADYDKVLQLKPDDPGTLNNLAWVLSTSPEEKIRDGRRAIELATKACEETDYERSYILSTLAAAYAEAGQFDEAIQWAEKGVEKADNDEIRQAVQKELESYQAGKPWREKIEEKSKPRKTKSTPKSIEPPIEPPIEPSVEPTGEPPSLPPVESPPVEPPPKPPAKPLALPTTGGMR